MFSRVKVEEKLSETDNPKSTASVSQVFMIFATLTVSAFLTKNDVTSDTFFDTSLKHNEGYTK